MRNRRRRMFLQSGGGGGSLPDRLFANGELGQYVVPNETLNYTDEAKTTIAGPGDPVWWLVDKSGNGNDWQAVSSSTRALLAVDGNGVKYLNHTLTSQYRTPTRVAGVTTSVCTGFFQDSNSSMAVATAETGSGLLFLTQSGGSSAGFRWVTPTSPAVTINGSPQVNTTRGALYTATQMKKCVVTIEGFTYDAGTAFTAELVRQAHLAGESYYLRGPFYGYVEIGRAFADEERAELKEKFADMLGVTLA